MQNFSLSNKYILESKWQHNFKIISKKQRTDFISRSYSFKIESAIRNVYPNSLKEKQNTLCQRKLLIGNIFRLFPICMFYQLNYLESSLNLLRINTPPTSSLSHIIPKDDINLTLSTIQAIFKFI